jgi:hypothetical protein
MEAASTCETSVNFYQTTRRSIPGDSHLHTPRRENLKSHSSYIHARSFTLTLCLSLLFRNRVLTRNVNFSFTASLTYTY